jgi:hypothetical protein
MKIKREGEPEDPMEGSNVTLLCDFHGYVYPHSPNWFYQNRNGEYHQLNFANTNFKNEAKLNEMVKISEQPTKGLTQTLNYVKTHLDSLFLLKCNADIQKVTEGYYDNINATDAYSYKSKLLVQNITLDSPYTKFKCQINDTFKEISFKVKGKLNRRLMRAIRISCSLLRV